MDTALIIDESGKRLHLFDDDYTCEGSLNIRDAMGPFDESEVLFGADVPPAMPGRYKTVKVQFAYNDGFAGYNREAANCGKNMEVSGHKQTKNSRIFILQKSRRPCVCFLLLQ